MAGQSPLINLTARVFATLRDEALDLLNRRVLEPAYGDYIATGVAPAVVSVLAYFQEQNAFYADRRRRNSYLFLADSRESVVVLARAQGYRARPATSASVAVLVTPSPPRVAPITIRKGTRISVGDLTFEAAQDFVIPANATIWPDGTTDDLVIFVEGATRVDPFTSDGTASQSFRLSAANTIDGSVSVTVIGEEWQEVENLTFVESDQRGHDTFEGDGTDSQTFVLSLYNANILIDDEDSLLVMVTPAGQTSSQARIWTQVDALTGAAQEYVATQDTAGETTIRFGLDAAGAAPGVGDVIDILYIISGAQKRYQLVYDEFDRATITLGDGTNGLIPPDGAGIEVTYRVGGGVRGNVPASTIDQVVQAFLPTGARTAVRIRNVEPGRGGEEPESIERVRYFAPRFAKANRRAVTREDWTALAATYRSPTFGAPSHANAYLKQTVPELNTVVVAVWGRDELGRVSTPSTALKAGILQLLNARRTITTVAEMIDGEVVVVDMLIGVVLDVGRNRETVFAAVRTAVEGFFDSAFVLPGLDLSISRLYDTIQSVDGVRQAVIENLDGATQLNLDVGTGDGVTTEFSGDFVLLDGTALVPGSLAVTDTQQQAIDNGNGSFLGDVDLGGVNVVTYADGRFTITFATPPLVGLPVTAEAKRQIFAPQLEDLGTSDGTLQVLNGATEYYPIVARAPRGGWAPQQALIVDDFRVGVTNRFRGRLPRGITPGSIVIEDNVPGAPVLVGADNGAGGIIGAGILSGSVDYDTGDIDFEFNAVPTLPVRVSWTTNRVNVFLPAEYLPLTPGRVWFWGGYRGPTATQPGGADINVFDDGDGNMVGDALVGGTVSYETGEVNFAWNAVVPPGAPSGPFYGRLLEVPDGVRTDFTYEVRTLPGGAGVAVDLREGFNDGEGRTRFRLSDLSTPGVAIQDAWDNWQGGLHGDSLNTEGDNTLTYGPAAVGQMTFQVPLAPGTTQDFEVYVTGVGVFMYSAWVFRVKTPGGPGLDKYLFADNNGRLWGTSTQVFPVDRLDALRGRYLAVLSGSPVANGRPLQLTYDALVNVPPALDVPILGSQVATVGTIQIEERAQEDPNVG